MTRHEELRSICEKADRMLETMATVRETMPAIRETMPAVRETRQDAAAYWVARGERVWLGLTR